MFRLMSSLQILFFYARMNLYFIRHKAVSGISSGAQAIPHKHWNYFVGHLPGSASSTGAYSGVSEVIQVVLLNSPTATFTYVRNEGYQIHFIATDEAGLTYLWFSDGIEIGNTASVDYVFQRTE